MINLTQDVHSLTKFKRDTSGLMKRLTQAQKGLGRSVDEMFEDIEGRSSSWPVKYSASSLTSKH